MPTEHIQPRFDILAEGTPQRCDICHQSDQFDPATGTCARCVALPVPQASATFGTDVLRRFDIPERFRDLVLREVGDEAVLWVGRPSLKKFTYRSLRGLLETVIIPFVLGVFMSALFSTNLWPPLIFCSLIGLALIANSTIVREYFRARRTLYLITQRRALVLVDGRETTVESYFPNQIRKLILHRRRDGSGDLLFDDSSPGKGGEKLMDKGFYAIEDVAEVERIVRTRLVEKNPS